MMEKRKVVESGVREVRTKPEVVYFLDKVVQKDGVQFLLGDGQSLTTRLAELEPEILHELALHGLSQKIGDSASGCSKDKAFGVAFRNMLAVYEGLKAGRWTAARAKKASAAGLNQALTEDLIQALMKLQGLPLERVEEAVHAADAATIAGWMKNPRVSLAVAEETLRRLQAVADGAEEVEFDLPI